MDQRPNIVNINGVMSDPYITDRAIPQGSSLSGLLFCVYMNSVHFIKMESNILTNMDDFKIFKAVINERDIQLLQKDLNEVVKHLEALRLQINTVKTIHISFTLKQYPLKAVFRLNNHKLPQVEKYKDLGVMFDDNLPWWRVDLTEMHYVTEVNIYFKAALTLHTRLHDVAIRVGMKDIAEIPLNIVFEENNLCKLADEISYLQRDSNSIACNNLGRYVSIQITKYCTALVCHSKTENILSLCEVAVYGYPVEIKEAVNIGTNKPNTTRIFFDYENQRQLDKTIYAKDEFTPLHIGTGDDFKMATGILDYPYWRLNLQDNYVVEGITLYLDDDLIRETPAIYEIRIGSQDILYAMRGSPFTKNSLCLRLNIYEAAMTEKNEIKCLQPTVGRYVSAQLQQKCENDDCLDALAAFLKMEVWGYPLKKRQIETKIFGQVSDKTSDPITWYSRTKSSTGLHYGNTGPSMEVTRGVYTLDTSENPWWKIKLESRSVVQKVIIYYMHFFPHDLYDFQIRVGINEPTSNPESTYSQNPLCYDIHKIYKGRGEYICSKPIVGTYVSVQLTGCYSCPKRRAMTFCGIEVFGYKISDEKNVALHKSTSQNYTYRNATSSLAVDGKITNRMYANYGYPGCGSTNESRLDCDSENKTNCRPSSCAELFALGFNDSGVYKIYPTINSGNESFDVYCDMHTDGGGWTVIQRRREFVGGFESFQRNWTEYQNGFGNLCKEFWLGNDKIYWLSNQEPVDLRIHLRASETRQTVETYKNFSIGEDSENYKLNYDAYIGAYPTYDSYVLRYLRNASFYTEGRYEFTKPVAGWWMISGTFINLNEQPFQGTLDEIQHLKNTSGFLTTQMMIRPASMN